MSEAAPSVEDVSIAGQSWHLSVSLQREDAAEGVNLVALMESLTIVDQSTSPP